MNFVDNTCHIFPLTSYDREPLGYKYEDFKYTFWLDKEYSHKLSVKNYYMMPIRILCDNGVADIEIVTESDIYKLVGSSFVHQNLSENFSIDITDVNIKDKLVKNDIAIISDKDNDLVTFYILGYSDQPGTITTNILIKIATKTSIDYCPIAVGGVWCNESEELIINTKNTGIDLPKDILKAVYRNGFLDNAFDETLWNTKVKELLLNFMNIKGECGNLHSAKNALSWFEWGDKIDLRKLVRTDNEIFVSYVYDNLNLNNDLLDSFKYFASTSLLSLQIHANADTDEHYAPDYSADFWGESHPVLENLFDKVVTIDRDKLVFYTPYYDYTLAEMSLKLACLKYMYEKYFLPIHSAVYSASVNTKVYANDIKLIDRTFNTITEKISSDISTVKVEFDANDIIYINNQEHWVDECYNEYTNSKELGENTDSIIYYVNELCFSIPIKYSNASAYNCKYILTANDIIVYESKFFAFTGDYKCFVCVPKILNISRNVNYWLDKDYVLYVYCNGSWFSHHFTLAIPEFSLQFGILEYNYEFDRVKQINSITDEDIDFCSFMYLPDLVNVNNINFPRNIIDYTNKDNLSKFISLYREGTSIHANKKYYNQVHYCKLLDMQGKEIPYTGTTNDIDLYRYFFNDDGTYKEYISRICNHNDRIQYDFYLMHDDTDIESYRGILSNSELANWEPKWYVVFISKQTLAGNLLDSDLELDLSYMDTSNTYRLSYVASDEKFLINRMTFKSANGKNVFNQDDIICASVNNIELPFILENGSHWVFEPFSIGMETDARVTSTTNACLISLGGDNSRYETGYYDVHVHYSIDANTTEEYIKRAKIRII